MFKKKNAFYIADFSLPNKYDQPNNPEAQDIKLIFD